MFTAHLAFTRLKLSLALSLIINFRRVQVLSVLDHLFIVFVILNLCCILHLVATAFTLILFVRHRHHVTIHLKYLSHLSSGLIDCLIIYIKQLILSLTNTYIQQI